jgi:hypothetical protein
VPKCDRETSKMRRVWPKGVVEQRKKYLAKYFILAVSK